MASGRWWSAPNLLTIGRMAIAPFAVAAIVRRQPVRALVLIGAAAVTDFLDGLVARATHTETEIGRLLDPIADKLLMSGVYVGLASTARVPRWVVIVVFGRDAVLIAGSLSVILLTSNRDLRPTLLGKASTAVQIAAAATFLAEDVVPNPVFRNAGRTLIWSVAVLAVASGAHYLLRGVRTLKRR